MTLGQGQGPRISGKNGWIQLAFLLGKSVCSLWTTEWLYYVSGPLCTTWICSLETHLEKCSICLSLLPTKYGQKVSVSSMIHVNHQKMKNVRGDSYFLKKGDPEVGGARCRSVVHNIALYQRSGAQCSSNKIGRTDIQTAATKHYLPAMGLIKMFTLSSGDMVPKWLRHQWT